MDYDFVKDLSLDELKELKELIEEKTTKLSVDNLKSDPKFLELLNLKKSSVSLNKSKFTIDNVELNLYFGGLNSVQFAVGNVEKIKNIPAIKSVVDKYYELDNKFNSIVNELSVKYDISVLEIEGLIFKEGMNK